MSKIIDEILRGEIEYDKYKQVALRRLNATNLDGKKGTIPARKVSKVARVLSYERQDVPVVVRRVPMPLVKTFGVIDRLSDFLKNECTKYIDPTIAYELYPLKLTNLVYHAWSVKLEGDIVNQMNNKGQDGQKGTKEVWRWEDCPEADSEYNWKVVEGSADLGSSLSHEIKDEENRKIDTISQNISVNEGKKVSVSAHWSSSWVALVLDMLELLVTGGIVLNNGYDVTVTYEWRGDTHRKKEHIDARVWVPLEGNIKWEWN